MAGRGGGTSASAAARPAAGLLAGAWRPAGAVRIGGWRAWLKACVAREVEQRRLFPWLAVAFGCGVLLYFSAEGRPALWAPLVGFLAAAAVAARVRARPVALAVALAFCAVFAGFAAGLWRERRVDAPVLSRMTIAHALRGAPAAARPRHGARPARREARRLHRRSGPPAAAARSRAPRRLRLRPRRLLQWHRVGSLTGKIEIRPAPARPPFALAVNATIDQARNALTRRIADVIGGQAGAVSAALVRGKRGLIGEPSSGSPGPSSRFHLQRPCTGR